MGCRLGAGRGRVYNPLSNPKRDNYAELALVPELPGWWAANLELGEVGPDSLGYPVAGVGPHAPGCQGGEREARNVCESRYRGAKGSQHNSIRESKYCVAT